MRKDLWRGILAARTLLVVGRVLKGAAAAMFSPWMKHSFLGMGTTLALLHCGGTSSTGSVDAADAGVAPGPVTVTFHRDVAPILQKHCYGCHAEGGIAPFSLTSYASAKPMSGPIAAQTHDRVMPPWGAAPSESCKPLRPFKYDNSLSEKEIATLDTWHKEGAPEGDAKDAPAPIAARTLNLENPEMTLETSGYTMTGAGSDQMRCFVLDPKLTERKYLNGLGVIPGELGIVHHALIFADPKGEGLKRAKAAGTADQYDCFGGPQIDNPRMIGTWVPGAVPYEFPPNIGTVLEAGTSIVMQVHYHADGKGPRVDKTKVQMRFLADKPEYYARSQLIGNFTGRAPNDVVTDGLQPGADGKVEFLIPPGATEHEEVMKFTLPKILSAAGGVYIGGLGGHMHYVGVREEVRLRRAAPKAGQPADECLLNIPRWDFDWQQGFSYDTAAVEQLPEVTGDDELYIKCTYNNSTKNPKMSRMLRESGLSAPQPVGMGEGTLDEMCLAGFVFLSKFP
jgi:hypothetical protein